VGSLVDLKGKRFGRLVVVERAGSLLNKAVWRVSCDCGQGKIVIGSSLIKGVTRSCGCLKRDVNAVVNRTHGLSYSRTYRVWAGIKGRCSCPTQTNWEHYGGRGIQMCTRWHRFENFLTDMGEAPQGSTIERVNNNGNYEPTNCRWASMKEQCRNRKTTRLIEFAGQTLCLVDWAAKLNIAYMTLVSRLNRGWTTEQALTIKSKGER